MGLYFYLIQVRTILYQYIGDVANGHV